MIIDAELQAIADELVYKQPKMYKWLVQALRKHIKRGLVPQPWYLANSSTIRTMYRKGMKGKPRLHPYDNQLVRKYMSDEIIRLCHEEDI